MSHNPKEAEREMEKAIFISADCFLAVFELLPPRQLGLGIALISHRFDYYVDEHFKTRKWTLEDFYIRRKIGENGTKEMEIVNCDGKLVPIPQIPLPNKVIGFGGIEIRYIDQNVLTFLCRFKRFFATCFTRLTIFTENDRISEFVVLNIWPILKDTIHELYLATASLRQLRHLAPSILNDCPVLRAVISNGAIFPEFPCDDSANASDGQAVAKWLFTPHPNNVLKELLIRIENSTMEQWSTNVEQIQAAFSDASSSVHFAIYIRFPPSFPIDSVLSFNWTNQMTGEELIGQKTVTPGGNGFMLIRRPIDGKEMNASRIVIQNGIDIFILKDEFVEDLPGPSGDQKQKLLDTMIGPSDQQQK